MNKKLESYKLVIIFLIFILIISIIGLMFYKNLSKDTTTTITATVKYKGNDYIVVADTNNKEYKLKVTDDIEENDVLSITIDHIDDTTDPATANVKEMNTISKTITFTIEDPKKEDNSSNEKIEIIIDELSKGPNMDNLMSFLNINTKLLNYEIKEKQMVLTFNEDILSSIEDKSILEEVINTINYSIDDNYDVNEVVFRVGEEEILKNVLKTLD